MRNPALIVLPLLLLAGCAGTDSIGILQPDGYVREAEQIVRAADWSNPETITMALTNHAFTPNVLTFHHDRPTRLVLDNQSDSTHTFVAPPFFKAIAAKSIVGPQGAEEGYYLERIVIPPRTRKEVLFVPVRVGHYFFECNITGHSMLGMKGAIDVM